MKKYITLTLLAFAFIFVSGCAKEPIQTNGTNNPNVSLSLLFEHEGYSIYRFYDAGHYHYYVVPEGIVIDDKSEGKSTRGEEIQTVGK